MKTRTLLVLCVGVFARTAPASTLLDTNGTEGFRCENSDATAMWAWPQETELESDGRLLKVEVLYSWADTDTSNDFRFTFEFSGGSGSGEAVQPQ